MVSHLLSFFISLIVSTLTFNVVADALQGRCTPVPWNIHPSSHPVIFLKKIFKKKKEMTKRRHLWATSHLVQIPLRTSQEAALSWRNGTISIPHVSVLHGSDIVSPTQNLLDFRLLG